MNEQKTENPKEETTLTLKHAMLATVFKKTEATKFLELIDEEVMSEVCDVKTKKGRDRERSLAAGISSFKVHMNKLALASIDDHMVIVKSTKEYLKEFNASSDKRRDARKSGAMDWSIKEDARRDGHRQTISMVKDLFNQGIHAGAPILTSLIERINSIDISKIEEFSDEGKRLKEDSLKSLEVLLEAAKDREAQAIEIVRLQKVESEAKTAEAKRIKEEEDRKAEADRIEAEKIEGQRVLKEIEANRKRQEEIEKQRKADEAKRIEQAKADAIKAEREEVERLSAKAESERVTEEKAEAKRKANKKHQKDVCENVVKTLVTCCGLTDFDAQCVTDALLKNEIPNVTINF